MNRVSRKHWDPTGKGPVRRKSEIRFGPAAGFPIPIRMGRWTHILIWMRNRTEPIEIPVTETEGGPRRGGV